MSKNLIWREFVETLKRNDVKIENRDDKMSHL